MSKKSYQTTANNNHDLNMFTRTQGGTYYQSEYHQHMLQQYRSPPRIEATITVPPSHEKSVINAVMKD
jgi:hypothetical protein